MSTPGVKVPRLRLAGPVATIVQVSPSSALAAAPTPDRASRTDRLACPLCRHASTVSRWRPWRERGEWVWHCAHQSRAAKRWDDKFCGYMWIASRPMAVCDVCLGLLRIRERGPAPGGQPLSYWCDTCQDYQEY